MLHVGFWRDFVTNDEATGLVEYSLLLAFICLAGAAAIIGMGIQTSGIWTAVNNRLASSNQGS